MKTLRESILGDMDSTLDNMESDAKTELYNLNNIPTVKDFDKNFTNNKWHEVTWYCPNVIKRYRSMYPDNVPADADSISIVLDATFSKVVDCNIYFTTGKGTKGMTHRKRSIRGWNDGMVGSNLRTYKKMAISILYNLAHKPEILDEVMKYSDDYRKTMASDDYKGMDFHRRAVKWPIKSILNLIG